MTSMLDAKRRYAAVLRRVAAVLLLLAGLVPYAAAQNSGGPVNAAALHSYEVAEVVVELEGAPADETARARLESDVRKAFRVFPGSRVSELELTLAVQRVIRTGLFEKFDYRFEFSEGAVSQDAVRLVLRAVVGAGGRAMGETTGILKSGSAGDFPILYKSPRTLVKLNTTAVGHFASHWNSWLGNGQTLGAGFPLAEDIAATSIAPSIEGSLALGAAVATQIVKGANPTYAYVNANYLSVGTAGQDIYSSRSRFSTSLEQIYGGVVGGGYNRAGSRWGYHVSYGRQTPCPGTGFFFCGISGNGGNRGGFNSWARTAGRQMGLAQFRWNDLLVDNYYIQSNEVPPVIYSNSRMYVLNVQKSRGYGFAAGGTYVRVLSSTFPYVLPDFNLKGRAGLNAYNGRVAYTPPPEKPGPIMNAEGGLETNSRFPMRSYAFGLEGGWSFATTKWSPWLGYKYSRYSGDDAATTRYERWDPLYGGKDFETWMPGMLMKNIQFNSNMHTSRFQLRLTPARGYRYVALLTNFRALESINYPYSISFFARKPLGNEFVSYLERMIGSAWYMRLSFGSYWPGAGVKAALPSPVAAPWVTFQAQIRYAR